MTPERARAYVRQWVEAGRLLESSEGTSSPRSATCVALEAADVLIGTALQVPLPPARRTWSGLVEQQAAFHRKRL